MYKHILIATDGSERSDKGVDTGLDIARGVGARVTVLTVSEPFPAYDLGTRVGLFRDEAAIRAYDEACATAAGEVLARATERATAVGIECETLHVADSAPAKAILDTAKERGADLIVVTSHGRGGLERFLLGSQASRVVQSAETSVLVVR